jgi:hypothetical protein
MDQNQQAVELFNKLAQRYQDSYMNVKLYAKTLDSLCLALPSQAQVLYQLALMCDLIELRHLILFKHDNFILQRNTRSL